MSIKKIALGLVLATTPAYAAQQKDVAELLKAMRSDKKTEVTKSVYNNEIVFANRLLNKKIGDSDYRISDTYKKGEKSQIQIDIFKEGLLIETFTDKGLDGIVEDHMLNKEWKVMENNDGTNKYISTFGNDRTKSNQRFIATIQDILKIYKRTN